MDFCHVGFNIIRINSKLRALYGMYTRRGNLVIDCANPEWQLECFPCEFLFISPQAQQAK